MDILEVSLLSTIFLHMHVLLLVAALCCVTGQRIGQVNNSLVIDAPVGGHVIVDGMVCGRGQGDAFNGSCDFHVDDDMM